MTETPFGVNIKEWANQDNLIREPHATYPQSAAAQQGQKRVALTILGRHMGYIGTAGQIEEQFVANFGNHILESIRQFRNSPAMIEASVARHFARYGKAPKYNKDGEFVAKKAFENSTWKGFVDVPLSAEAKEQYAAWDVADSDVWDGLAVYGEKGYKFSLVWSTNNSTWIATFTGAEGCGVNEGWAITARARAPYDASRVLLFKVSVLLPDKWKDFKADPSDDIA